MTAYATLEDVHIFGRITDSNSERDAAISFLLEPISRLIDNHCKRKFYASTETHRYDYQQPDRLWLKRDLISITTLTNGDGETLIASTDYFLYPEVGPPYRWIEINRQGGKYFQWSGTPQQCIVVTGSWGYSTTPPDPIKRALCYWILAILADVGDGEGSNMGVASKSIGSYSVSYGRALEIAKLDGPPGLTKQWLSGYIFRDFASNRAKESYR